MALLSKVRKPYNFQSYNSIKLNLHGLAAYVKDGHPFLQDSSLENFKDTYLYLRLGLLHSVSYFFFIYRSPSSYLCTIFHAVLSKIDEALSINQSANVFVFGGFNVHTKDWLNYSDRTDRLLSFAITFLSQTALLRWLTFLLRSVTVTLTILLFWTYFFLLTLVFVLLKLSLHREITIKLLYQFP